MNEIVISRIPVPSVGEQTKLIQTEKNHHNTPQTPPLTTQPSNYVPRETPTILKRNKTTHPTTKATRSQPTKPQQPPQTNHHVSRETSPNTQPTTTQKPYSEAHTKGSTASKSSKSSHTSKLIQPLEKSIHANRRQTGKNTLLSYFSLKFIQHPQTWLVSVGKERQAR